MWKLEHFKLGVGTSNAQIEEQIIYNYYLCDEKMDRYKAKSQMEVLRLKKTKGKTLETPYEDQIILEISYIPSFIIDGEHEIKYLRKNMTQLALLEDVIAINIGESIFNINDLRQLKDKKYQIDFIELVSHKNTNKLAFDHKGNSIKETEIPKYHKLDEEATKEILEQNLIIKTSISEKTIIENLKRALMKPAADNIRTIEEKITITVDIILRAIYKGSIKIFDKTKTMEIDSVSGESSP